MRWVTGVLVITVATTLAACTGGDAPGGGSGNDRAGGAVPSDFGNAPGTGDPAGTAGSGGTDFGNGTGMTTAPTVPTVEPTTPEGGECGSTSVAAEQVVVEEVITIEEEVTSIAPVAMYIMLDQSGSMILLWPAAVTSIQQFVMDSASDGVDVAMGYFPLLGGTCNTGGLYDTPEVPLGRLPGHAQAIIDNLGLHAPFGIGTPTEGALRGVTQFCERFQSSNPDEKCVAVLISDGAPTDEGGTCAVDQATLSGIAGQSFANGVLTYTVGLAGADFNMLNAIATEGGTDCDPSGANTACDVTAGSEKLVEALRVIRDEVVTIETRTETVSMTVETPLECEWQIPEAPEGEVFDREKVNVKLSSATMATPELGQVASPDDCAANGWHYDDPDAPTRIIACPETCDTIQATPQATIDVLLGCATIPLE